MSALPASRRQTAVPALAAAALLVGLTPPAAAAVATEPAGPYTQRVGASVGASIFDAHGAASGPVTGSGWLRGPGGLVPMDGTFAGADWTDTTTPGGGLAAQLQSQTVARFEGSPDQRVPGEAWAMASASSGLLQVRSSSRSVSERHVWPEPNSLEWVWGDASATAALRGSYGVTMSRSLAAEVEEAGTSPLALTIQLSGEIGPVVSSGPFASPFLPTVWLDITVFNDYRVPDTWEQLSLRVDAAGSFTRAITIQPRNVALLRFGGGGNGLSGPNCLDAASLGPAWAWVPCTTFGGYEITLRTSGTGPVSAALSAQWTALDGVTEVSGGLAGWGSTPVDADLLTPVPEPDTAVLLALGSVALAWRLRRRQCVT